MPRVLVYVDPHSPEDGRPLRLAADLVEFLSATDGGTVAPDPVGIVASVEDTLAIALPALGRGQARTVEGGERRSSNVAIFPFRQAFQADGEEAEREEIARSGLVELVALGAVEAPLARDGEWPLLPLTEVLQRAWGDSGWNQVAAFGDTGAIQVLRDSLPTPDALEVVSLPSAGEFAERARFLLERAETRRDEWTERRLDGLIEALQFKDLHVRLGLDEASTVRV
jgi:hypothetical protein